MGESEQMVHGYSKAVEPALTLVAKGGSKPPDRPAIHHPAAGRWCPAPTASWPSLPLSKPVPPLHLPLLLLLLHCSRRRRPRPQRRRQQQRARPHRPSKPQWRRRAPAWAQWSLSGRSPAANRRFPGQRGRRECWPPAQAGSRPPGRGRGWRGGTGKSSSCGARWGTGGPALSRCRGLRGF